MKPGYRQKGEPPKGPHWGSDLPFFLLAFTFLQAAAQKALLYPDWCQPGAAEAASTAEPWAAGEPEESRKVYHPPSLEKKTNLPALWRQRLTYSVSLGTSKRETLPKHFLYLPFGLGSLLPLKGGTRTVSALSFQGFHPVSSFLGKISVPSKVSVPLLVPRCATWGYTVRSQHTTSKGKSRINFLPSAPNELMRFTKGAGAENWPKSPGDLH